MHKMSDVGSHIQLHLEDSPCIHWQDTRHDHSLNGYSQVHSVVCRCRTGCRRLDFGSLGWLQSIRCARSYQKMPHLQQRYRQRPEHDRISECVQVGKRSVITYCPLWFAKEKEIFTKIMDKRC